MPEAKIVEVHRPMSVVVAMQGASSRLYRAFVATMATISQKTRLRK